MFVNLHRGTGGGMGTFKAMTCALLAAFLLQAVPSVKQLFPVDLDTTWMYEKQTDLGMQPSTYAITVTGKSELKGVAVWEFSTSDAKRGAKTLFRVSDDGVYIVATGSPMVSLDPPIPVLVGPLAKGKRWSYKGSVGVMGGAEVGKTDSQVLGMEKLSVLGKEVDCVKVESKSGIGRGKAEIKVTRHSWYAYGIGLVREITSYVHGKQRVTDSVTLTRFATPEKK